MGRAVVHDGTPCVDEGGGGEDIAENVSPTEAHGETATLEPSQLRAGKSIFFLNIYIQ